MAPVRLSHTWARRVYVGLFILAFGYLVAFLLQFFEVIESGQFHIDILAAIGSGVTLILAILGFSLVKKNLPFIVSYGAYLFFAVTTAYVIEQTGGISSPLLGVWALVAFVAALYGVYAWLPVMIVSGVYAALLYLNNDLTAQNLIVIFLSSLLPVIAGMIIWRDTDDSQDPAEKNVKNLASQLSEVATKSEIVINAIGDGVVAIDGKGVIQLINPAAQELLGWGKQDALMLNYKSILKLTDEKGQDLQPTTDPIEAVLNTNQQARGKNLVVVTKSGKKLSIAMVVSPIGTPGSGAITVFRDITNERAEEREQAEFISTASHEMRTPVASIEGYLGLALNPNTAQIDQRARDFILKAHEAAQHLGRLFQDLLDVSKSEDGRMTNMPRVIDLVAYTQTITQGLLQKATDKGLKLIFQPTEAQALRKIMPVYYVNQDNDHIREILDNLIENAIKYTPAGTVTVDVTGTEDHVVVSVQDSGLGIPTEDLPHLFQKFYRVDNADRQSIGGTGLGLYLSRRLAESMQGRLWVESVFGQGSTFFLEIPRISSQEASALQQQQAAQAAQAATVTPAVPQVPGPAPQPAPIAAPAPTPVPSAPSQAPLMNQPLAAPQGIRPQPAPQAVTPVARDASQTPPVVRPATTVPRGESLTRDQIAERVRQLEALAQAQRAQPPTRNEA